MENPLAFDADVDRYIAIRIQRAMGAFRPMGVAN